MSWLNEDGLLVRFGLEKISDRSPRGEPQGAGDIRVVDVIVDCTKFVTGVPYIVPGVELPRNSLLQAVEYTVVEAITGTSALTVGTQHLDGTTYDADGILTALSALTVGTEEHIVKSQTRGGAQLGTILAYPANFIIVPTGTGTDGILSMRVHLFVPGKDANPQNFNP